VELAQIPIACDSTTNETTTSSTLEDIPNLSVDITTTATGHIVAFLAADGYRHQRDGQSRD
jgi:hypothetical protein